MAAGKDFNASDYIQHHLTFLSRPAGGEGGFWTVNVDSVVTAAILGIVGIGFLWWVVRDATPGVPNRRQAFVELMIDFIDEPIAVAVRENALHLLVDEIDHQFYERLSPVRHARGGVTHHPP